MVHTSVNASYIDVNVFMSRPMRCISRGTGEILHSYQNVSELCSAMGEQALW